MGIIHRLFGKDQRREVTGLVDTTDATGTGASTTKGGSYRSRVISAYSEETALKVAAVCRAAQVRSDSVGMMRLRLLTVDRKAGNMKEADFGMYRRENFILQVRPNSRQNAFQFWKRVEMMRMFTGHCYILPVWASDGGLQELIPCKGVWDRQGNRYILYEPDFGIKAVSKRADEVIVIRGVVTDVYPEGESIIHYAGRTATLSGTIEGLNLESAGKGGRQKLILQQRVDGSLSGIGGLDPRQMETQAKALEESIYNNDVIFDDSVSNITPINMNATDLQLLDTKKFSVADIARFFGVPRALLMDDSNSSYKTPEAATLEFMSRTLNPIKMEIESELNAKLLGFDDYGDWRYEFDTRALFALDMAAMGDYNKNRLETGVVSVNELRKEMNMPAIEGGDEHYVTCNIAPIGSPKLSGKGEIDNGGTDS